MKFKNANDNLEYSFLEARNLLAGISFDAGTGVVQINGSSNADQVYVIDSSATEILVTFNQTEQQVIERLAINEIIFRGGAGDDHFQNDTDVVTRAFGNKGNDTLIGGSGDDFLRGGKGTDRIEGRAGSDFIGGGHDRDEIFAGHGDDNVKASTGNDSIFGQLGNDWINAGDGDDVVLGGGGSDTILGRNGDDSLKGGDGDDRIEGLNGDDRIEGNSGDDSLYGNKGRDILFGGFDDDSLYGGGSSDRLFGDSGMDDILGGPGNDDLYGGDDQDLLRGGSGNDDYYSDDLDEIHDDSSDSSLDGDFEIRGAVESLNTSSKTFSVLGVAVNYSNAEFVASIQNGSFVKVEGAYNGSVLNAHEVELELDDRNENFETRGFVENFDSTNQAFVFFGFLVNYSGASVEGQLSNGTQIELEGRLTGNQVQAFRIETAVGEDNGGGNGNGNDDGGQGDPGGSIGEIELRGNVSSLNAAEQTFRLLGQTIDFSSAQMTGNIGNGSFVKIDGRIGQNLIVAREVEIETDDDRDENFEAVGEIKNLDTNNRTFEFLGFQVDYSNSELETTLQNDKVVSVEGALNNGLVAAIEIS